VARKRRKPARKPPIAGLPPGMIDITPVSVPPVDLPEHLRPKSVAQVMARNPHTPWGMISTSPIQTAEFLIQHAGSISAAHIAIEMADKQRGNPQGRQPINDWPTILLAASIQENTGCSATEAYQRAAKHFLGNDAATVKKAVRRMHATAKKVRQTRLKRGL
jgi:hypothetical protein